MPVIYGVRILEKSSRKLLVVKFLLVIVTTGVMWEFLRMPMEGMGGKAWEIIKKKKKKNQFKRGEKKRKRKRVAEHRKSMRKDKFRDDKRNNKAYVKAKNMTALV